MNQQSSTHLAFFTDTGFRSNAAFVLSLLVAVTLPFPNIILNSVLIILLSAAWLLDPQILLKVRNALTNRLFLLFASVYIIQVAGMVYTEDVPTGLAFLESKLSLLVCPLIFASAPLADGKKVHLIALAFAMSCFVRSVLSFVVVLLPYLQGDKTDFPVMTDFTDYLRVGHPYFGMYLVASLIFTGYFLSTYWRLLLPVFRALLVIAWIFMYLHLFLIGARTAMYTSFLLILLHILLYIWLSKKYKLGLFLLAGALCFVVMAVQLAPSVKERFLSIFTRSLAYNPVYIRSIQWQCSFEILKTNAVVGVGTGDVQPYLQECYQAKAFWGHLARYNAHNDYFEEALRHGLLGLFIYLVSLFYPLYLSLKQHQYMYTAFLLLFMCCCMTESMLNTQKGAVYFAFFNSLFAFHLLKAPLPDRRGKQVSNDGLRKRNSFTK